MKRCASGVLRRGPAADMTRPMLPPALADQLPVPVSRLRREMRSRLLPWFKAAARDLPWREEPRPAYAVWVSEIMLQQTRVDTVIPYFNRFMERFPTLKSFAGAPIGAVLKSWEGLGYYSRARNLHAAAKRVVEQHGGQVPPDPAVLRSLPGLGDYTTAAIASFAFCIPVAVLDGNVMRVLTRLFALDWDIAQTATRKNLQRLADALLLEDEPGACNEAWMELGALICTPKNPACTDCPLHRVCRAFADGTVLKYPVKQKAKPVPHKVAVAAVLQDARGRFLVLRRPLDKGLLAGLWHFPSAEQEAGESFAACAARAVLLQTGMIAHAEKPFAVVRHAFSHFTLELHVCRAKRISGRLHKAAGAEILWLRKSGFAEHAFAKADLEIIRLLQANAKGAP